MFAYPDECLSTNEGADMRQVESFISGYLNMLKNGNTSGILGLLTGPMLKKNENLLRNNPRYPDLLRKRYLNSSFVITNHKHIDDNKSSVDVVIRLNTQEETKVRFTLLTENGRLKIYAEEEIATVGGQ